MEKRDRVVKLDDLPRSSVGAAKPVVLADESIAIVAYHTLDHAPNQGNMAGAIAIVTFIGHRATLFGPPDDEAIFRHPLFLRGLRPYANYTVENSSWVKKLAGSGGESSDRRLKYEEKLKHYILAFHDSTFECAAESHQAVLFAGTIKEAIAAMTKKLQ